MLFETKPYILYIKYKLAGLRINVKKFYKTNHPGSFTKIFSTGFVQLMKDVNV